MKKKKTSRKTGKQRRNPKIPRPATDVPIMADSNNFAEFFRQAKALENAGDLKGAAQIYHAQLRSDSRNIRLLINLANVQSHLGSYEEAIILLKRAHDIEPANATIPFYLARLSRKVGRDAEAIKHFRTSIAANPGHAAAYHQLGATLSDLGAADAARDEYLNCLIVDPSHMKARHAVAQILPRVYKTNEEMALWRQRFTKAVTALTAGVTLDTQQEINDAVSALRPNFLLAYHEKDDRPLQEIYGSFASRIMNTSFGGLALPVKRGPNHVRRKQDRIRIGYASEHLCIKHTISMLFGHWIFLANHDRFIIHTYHLGNIKDANTDLIAAKSDVFRHLNGSVPASAKAIRDDDLDILVYPDIGMRQRSFLLAALRLAPIQCVSWGHPVTTGLPTVDYFLSSELMEPEGSEARYSEQLIKLPNLSIYHAPSQAKTTNRNKQIGRDHFGIPDDAFAYLCCQSPQKYLPRYDDIFPRLAARVPNCKFVFIEHASAELTNNSLKNRLCAAFETHGQNPDDFLHFVPWQPWHAFLALNDVCDTFLDTMGWSGGNTTLEALAQGLPVVTLPGEFMRGRHTYAMLKRIGADACIADTVDSYIETASRLALDENFRNQQIDIVRSGYDQLFCDRAAIDGLEAFYESLVNEPKDCLPSAPV